MDLDLFEVKQKMLSYIQNVLESSHPAFSGLPPCPFARKARLQNQIDVWVYAFDVSAWQSSSEVHARIESFLSHSTYEVLLVVHPHVQALGFVELQSLICLLNEQLSSLGLVVFGGHPEDAFEVNGIRTRQDPFINFTVQRLDKLLAARQMLKGTRYYDAWDDKALQSIGTVF